MTIENARSLAPSHVTMLPVLHSMSQNKREWGYDADNCRAYVIFGAPGKPISLYEYLNVAPEVATSIQESNYDSKTITDLLIIPKRTGKQYTRLYPPVS